MFKVQENYTKSKRTKEYTTYNGNNGYTLATQMWKQPKNDHKIKITCYSKNNHTAKTRFSKGRHH